MRIVNLTNQTKQNLLENLLKRSTNDYGDYEKTDYYVIDTRYARDEHTQKMYKAMGDDYSLLCETGYIKIYRLIGQER